MTTVLLETSAGCFTAQFSERGLAKLDFPDSASSTAASPTPAWTRAQRRWLSQTKAALAAVLRGRAPRDLPPLDLTAGTDFQRRVWAALLSIAPGCTQSYAELAAAIGRPRAARAVGGACGANPIPVLVPCHRVLAASGRLGGFSGGLEWKRRLLGGEGVRV